MPHSPRRTAFTRWDLLAVLTGLMMIATFILPALANSRPRSERVVCLNNLRQIGQAFHAWAADHGDFNPWWLGYRPSPTGEPDPVGGTRSAPLMHNVWFQYAWISNELRSPQVLACPSDPLAVPATDFSTNATGLLHPSRLNLAVSYPLGLHSVYNRPQSILASDQNFRPDFFGSNCSSAVTNTRAINKSPVASIVAWTNGIHGPSGNVLMTDGRVVETSSAQLRPLIGVGDDALGSNEHFMFR